MAIKLPKEVPAENYALCPSADDKCRICRLPYNDLKKIQNFRFEEDKGYEFFLDYGKEKFGFGRDMTMWSKHFNVHSSSVQKNVHLTSQTMINEILPPMTRSLTPAERNQQLQKAYMQVTAMTADFAQHVGTLNAIINRKLSDTQALEDEMKSYGALASLDIIAKFNKELRAQVKDVAALGAPKVLVKRLLETTMIMILEDMSKLFYDICGGVQNRVLQELDEKGLNEDGELNPKSFVKVFKPVANEFKNRMEEIQKQQLANADAALAEIERIV